MPNINKTFTRGRMNLDLDDRIIPNGEYREALNVQVSTSEDSDVGSAQNILGNTLRNRISSDQNIDFPDDSICVGQIADEKNNKLYYLITDDTFSAIIEYDIATDQNQIILVDSDNTILNFVGGLIDPANPNNNIPTNHITGINIVDDFLFFTDGVNEPKKINIQQFKNNNHTDFNTTSNFYVNNVSQGTLLEEHITVIKRKPDHPLKVELVGVNAQGTFGTTQPLSVTTADVFSATNTSLVPITVNNKTLLRTVQPNQTIVLKDGTSYTNTGGGGNAVSVLDAILLNINAGDILILSDPNAAGALPTNTQIRARVNNIALNPTGQTISTVTIANPINVGPYSGYTTVVNVEILSVDSSTPVASIPYDYQVENLNDILFDKDFPRFGYRYKYQDGEYSAFSPFTQAAFLPGIYNIHPTREPYNTGMQNTIKQINLTEFVTSDIPSGVVEIDLLYKAESSPAVYSIDTIKPTSSTPADPAAPNPQWVSIDGSNITVNLISGSASPSNTGYYSITSDTIYGILPENQLLRPFDNVPKKAKAQDFTAGRLIYGNYTQNLNINLDKGLNLNIDFEDRKIQDVNDLGKRSIKSLRDYQLGVVYVDAFGRETPVFTGGDKSTKKLPFNIGVGSSFKGAASNPNSIVASEIPIPEGDAKFLKFYIKETASEYYNLVLDRVYRAEEDGNLWLSFPSSDRNKIKEDDFIILKKALESDLQVDSDNKFKVIAISNEAPDFIRKKYRELGRLDGDGTLSNLYTNVTLQPRSLFNKIAFDKTQATSEQLQDLELLIDQGKIIHIRFEATDAGGATLKSKRYKVVALELISNEYFITFDEPIVSADGWIETSSGVLNTSLKTQVLVEEKELFEEFEGRFFVKILSDIITDEFLESQIGLNPVVNNVAIFNVFSLRNQASITQLWSSDTSLSDAAASNTPTNFSDTPAEYDGSQSSANEGVLEFGTGVAASSGWFVDQLHMSSQQPTVDPYANSGQPADYKNPPNNSPSLGYSFDVSLSGNLFKGAGSSAGISWITTTGNPNFNDSTTTVFNKDYNKINSLDGAITTTTYHSLDSSGGSGAKAWKKYLGNFSDVGEQVYGQPGETGKFFLHLSFSAVGEDLYDGSSPVANVYAGYNNNTNSRYNANGGDKWAQSGVFVSGSGSSQQQMNKINLQNIENHNNQKENRDKVCNITPAPTSGSQNYVNTQYDINKIKNQWNPAVNNPANQQIIDNLVPGNKIKIDGDSDPTRVFKILNVTKKRIYNHTSWNRKAIWDNNTSSWVEDEKTVHYAWWDLKLNATANNTKIQELTDALTNFGAAHNRRVCYILELDQDAGNTNPIDSGIESLADSNTSTVFSIQQNFVDENSTVLSDNPAVFETEPRTDEGLDIYFEASGSIPVDISNAGNKHVESVIPVGTTVEVDANVTGQATPIQDSVGCVVESWSDNVVALDPGLNASSSINYTGAKIRFVNKDGSYIEYDITDTGTATTGTTTPTATFKNITLNTFPRKVGLPYYNCFTFNNGVESNRIRDDFNRSFIKNGVKASSTIEEQYEVDERKSGLIYSGIYNKNTSLNELNQFRMAELITKDLEPTYGSIQKLHARDSDLIALCEDKIVQIAADKDIIFNADGNPQLTASNKVLGQSRPFVGEYGISKNPESFASASYRAYFTDKQRGAVMRLSMDGLTPISEAGMKDWFRDKFKGNYPFGIVGSYDDNKDTYNLTFDTGNNFVENPTGPRSLPDVDYRHDSSITVSYKESVKGWVSFRSFIQEGGVTLNNTYFTFRGGALYSHDNETRNNFYTQQHNSFISTIFNDIPTSVKNFNALSYSGDTEWNVVNIFTDIETGQSSEFVSKENKYFSYLYSLNTIENLDINSFDFQGLGNASVITLDNNTNI